ncbi:MAG: hypothetical protein LBI53_03560 [Candidatus Peribacteria bacterium]|jgi:hypothetical protein|nr:hypothetical protein [Candidatus Peribacteria bacterium]
MKLDVQIAKNGQNLSHFVTEVKLSNIHIFCNIKATNDGKYSIDCKFTSDVIRTLPTEELKKFIENI